MASASSFGSPPQDPKDIEIRELKKQVTSLTEKNSMAVSHLAHRKVDLDKANAVVDDQAARIVELQSELALARPTKPHDADRARRLQQIEDGLRISLERAESRLSQLMANWPDGFIMPTEPTYFRGNETSS